MSAALAVLAALSAGYGLGRWQPLHRASDWANWRRWGKRPAGLRFAAMYVVLSAENIGWLLAHPVRGWEAWQRRHDPPPPLAPPVRIRPAQAEESK